MRLILPLSLAVLCTAATAAPALAQTDPGRWSGSVFAGADFPLDGDVHGGATSNVPDLGGLNPALAGVSAELRIGARSFDDIYGETTSLGGELAYGVGPNAELFGSFRYQQADEGRVQVGGAFVPALNTELPVFGTFGELQSYALEAGYRRYFGEGGFKPYVAGRLGVVRTDAINATFEIPDAAITIADAPFYDDTTSASIGVDVGVSFDLAEQVSLRAETGLRYVTSLDGDDTALSTLGLSSINEEGSRLETPVRVALSVRF